MTDKKKRASKIIPERRADKDGRVETAALLDEFTETTPVGHYQVTLPRVLDTIGLTPHARALIWHVLQTIAAMGRCFENTRQLAAACNMSTGMVSKAKKELQDFDIIRYVVRGKKRLGMADEIKIGDLWPWNTEEFGDAGVKIPLGNNNQTVKVHNMNNNRKSKTKDLAVKVHNMKPSNRTRNTKSITHPESSISPSAQSTDSGARVVAATSNEKPLVDAAQLPLLTTPRSHKASTAGASKRLARERQRVAGPKVRIPDRFFPWLKRICYGVDDERIRLLSERQHKAVAQTLSIMVEAKIDLDDGLPRFEQWWKENWRSRDNSLPRPEQVRELWGEAMEATKPAVVAGPANNNAPVLDTMALIRRRNKKDGTTNRNHTQSTTEQRRG